jgi:hypothetical protein
MTPLLTLGFAMILGQVPEPLESMARKLDRPIVRSQARRLGVIPRFIQREGEKETWGGTMGAQGDWLAEAFTEALTNQAEGRFEVVKHGPMAEAFRALKLTPADLADREALKKLARQAGGLDALVVGRAVDVREPARPGAAAGRLVKSEITCNLIDLASGELIGSAYRDLPINPSLAAYRGEPPGTGTYAPLAVEFPDPAGKGANTPNLAAPSREGANPAGTRQDGAASGPEGGEVPALDDPRCPFPIQIIVDDMPRKFTKVLNPATGRREFYVDLEPGETYEIAIKNRTEGTIYGVVYVDGINILGVRRDPDDPRYWNMAPGQDCLFRGWYLGTDKDYKEVSFIVRPATDSIAAQVVGLKDGFSDRIGEIQCIFFGTEEGAKSEPGAKSMMPSKFGTAGGEARDYKVKEVMGPKRSEDRLISYVIHYAPKSQIEKRQILKD